METVHEGGYSLQTALHAPGVEAGMLEVTHGNGVSDEQASTFKLVIYIERFGYGYQSFSRRVTDLFEVEDVRTGVRDGRSLFRWREADDPSSSWRSRGNGAWTGLTWRSGPGSVAKLARREQTPREKSRPRWPNTGRSKARAKRSLSGWHGTRGDWATLRADNE